MQLTYQNILEVSRLIDDYRMRRMQYITAKELFDMKINELTESQLLDLKIKMIIAESNLLNCINI